MNRIITISREFGSGGRELGKRLSDVLGYTYYDREIIAQIAQKSHLDEAFVAQAIETSTPMTFPIRFGHTFAYTTAIQQNATVLLVAQQEVIRALAERGNCIIVGRCADTLLRDQHPFNLFVYADMAAKIARCRAREEAEEALTDNEMKKMIQKVDAGRARLHAMLAGTSWEDRSNYHLCVNTTNVSLKAIVPSIAEYCTHWFDTRTL